MKKMLPFLVLCITYSHLQSQNFQPIEDGSKVHFVIKNFGINTGGDLSSLSGKIVFDPQSPNSANFNVSVKASTIDTDNSMRDESLVGPLYFNAKNYPDIRIVSTKIATTNKSAEGYYYFYGNLTIKGVTKAISFPFLVQKDGQNFIFSGNFEINRLDFGIGEKSMVLGNKVTVELLIKTKPL